jgi:dihydrofolate synthase/folylpolyglutamate synthase
MSAPGSLPALARLESLDVRGMKLGLTAIGEVCLRLGNPERDVPSILVAGTNGKGSTAATLASIAEAAGAATGLYTSPHLERVNERVRVGREDVADEELDAMLAEVFAASDRAPEVPVTYFEAMTAAAFLTFSRRRLDLAVLEVGLGGRFDATNVAPASVSVVTPIGLDHTEELGATAEAIAGEKAGVFRAGRPALVASREPGVRRVFQQVAAAVGAELHEMSEETRIAASRAGLSGTRFRLETPRRGYDLETPLLGVHQAENAAAAVRAAELWRPELGEDAVVRGVASVRWPGRLERFEARGRPLFLDGCHNPHGADALARFLESAGLRADLVFGAMADKDIEAMAAVLGPRVRRIRLVPAGSPRAATPEELARRFAGARPDAAPAASLDAALEELLGDPSTESIIVAGSLYLVGEARTRLLSGRFEESR